MATKINLFIDQGSEFSKEISLQNEDGTPFDLTDYTGRSKFRRFYNSTNVHNISVILGGNTGIVGLSLSANASANIEGGRYLYDVEIVDIDSVPTRIFEGILTLNEEVTY